MTQACSHSDLIEDTKFTRPHLYILGAGASLAAFPNGDKNGMALPLLSNFVDTINLKQELIDLGYLPPYEDFESIYSDICTAKAGTKEKSLIEEKIFSYFSSMKINDEPTLYDYLLLSLREKDTIATFNWDPLLCQAAERTARIAPLPRIIFLHGTTGMKVCYDCSSLQPYHFINCMRCGKKLENISILYPVKNKNYSDDLFISHEWNVLKNKMKSAYCITVFGYSAPKTDVDAIAMLKEGWGEPSKRELEQIEIIDRPGKSWDEVGKTWEDFTFSHHWEVAENFFTSWAGCFPRRSCEAIFEQFMMCRPAKKDHDWRNFTSFSEIESVISPYIQHEKKAS